MPDSELINALSGGGLLSSIANPRVLNPNLVGDTYGKATDIANGLWRNRLAQSQQAVGENLLAATGQDGTVDTGKLAALNARNPTTALSAGASAQTGQALRSNDMGFNQAQQGAIGRSVGSVLTLPDAQQTPDNYKQMLDYALANHGIDQGHYNSALQALTAAGADPGALRQFGTKLLVGTLAGPEMAQTVLPSNQDVNDGQTVRPMVRQPAVLGGGMAPAPGSVPIGFPSRTAALEQVGQPADAKTAAALGVPIGTIISGPMLLRWQQQGAGSNLTGGLGGGAAYAGKPNPLLGDLPSPLAGPNGEPVAPPPSPPQVAPAPAAGGLRAVVTSPPPGTGEQAVESNKRFNDISDQSVAARSRGAVLDNMLADTSQFTTGPGTDVIARVRAVANRLGLNVNTEGLSAVESFKKLAAALNAGQGSDARLSVSEASNPHADLSPAGIDLMLRQLRGNEDYNQARGKLAAAHPDKTNIAGFEDKTGSQLDPRTFQYDRMTGPQKATYFNSLPDKAKFVKAHDAAAALLPGGQ